MICFESSYVAYQIYGMCYYSEGKVWETRGADEPAGRGGQGFAQAAPAWKKMTGGEDEETERRRWLFRTGWRGWKQSSQETKDIIR